jgi:hypothetical protein
VTTVSELPPDPAMAAFLKLASEEEPLVVSLTRRPDHMAWEASYPGLKRLVPKLVDFLIEAQFQPSQPILQVKPAAIDRPTIAPVPRR